MNNVAFDLHSDNVYVRIDDAEGKELFEKKIDNDMALILEELEPYVGEARFVLETTGNWYWLVDGLKEAGHDEVYLANALKLRAIAEAKVKTDVRDARKLAQLLRTGDIPPAYAYPAGPREIRDLVRHRRGMVHRRTRCYQIMRSTMRKYNVKRNLSKDGLKRLTEVDIDLLALPETVRFQLKQLVRESQLLRREVHLVEEELEKLETSEPMVKELRRIPGVGPISALAIFYESGDVSRFPSEREYSSYCRVVKGSGNSNRKVGPGRKGKEGNGPLKDAYMQAALGAARLDSRIRKFSKRYRERHSGRGVGVRANNVVAHRMAIAAYHMLRKRVPFDESLFFAGMTADSPAHSTGRGTPRP